MIEPESTHMFREAAQSADAVRAQFENNHARALDLGRQLRAR